MLLTKTTTDHNKIKKWAEARNGRPAIVRGTQKNGSGLLRINFPGYAEEKLKDISWDEFFETFEDKHLAFLYQQEVDRAESKFFRLVDRTGE